MFARRLVLAAFIALGLALGPLALAAPGQPWPTTPEHPMPKQAYLCGEKIPLEDRGVYERFERELVIAAYDQAQVVMWFKRARRYFPYIERSLKNAGLPDDLKYLAVAESALITNIRSDRSALGVWQFMADTARRMGLRKDRHIDERLHFERSTQAALDYLKILHEKFGAWNLALAAYNCGDARLARLIEEQGHRDYFQLELPTETERFLFRIATAKLILEDPAVFGFALDEARAWPELDLKTSKVRLEKRVSVRDLAARLDLTYREFKELNPHILGDELPPGELYLTYPPGLEPRLISSLKVLEDLDEAPASRADRPDFYVVRPGDNLSRISGRTGVSVGQLKKLNRLAGDTIHPGQRLRLYP